MLLCLAIVHVGMHSINELGELMAEDDAHAGQAHRRALLPATQLSTGGAALSAVAMRAQGVMLLPMRRMLRSTETSAPAAAAEAAVEWQYESHGHSFPVGACVILFGFLLALTMQELVAMVAARCINGSRSPGQRAPTAGHTPPHAQQAAPAKASGVCVAGPMSTDTTDTMRSADSITIKEVDTASSDSDWEHALAMQQRHTLALVFELGCVMHSFIIGMSLGVALPRSEAVALMVALTFHQLLEGVMLGVLLASLSTTLYIVLIAVAVFVVTCPVGVALGIGIAFSYDGHSTEAMAAQGVINGVAAGMLLYLAFCVTGMWVSSLTHTHAHAVECGEGTEAGVCTAEGKGRPQSQSSVLARILGIAAYAAGMAVFSVLALWA